MKDEDAVAMADGVYKVAYKYHTATLETLAVMLLAIVHLLANIASILRKR